jgi:hypothetical protein
MEKSHNSVFSHDAELGEGYIVAPSSQAQQITFNFAAMKLLRLLLLTTLAVAKQPNILFVLTDDQGKHVGGLEHMPKLQVSLFPFH